MINGYTVWGSSGTGQDSTWDTGSYTGPATLCAFVQSYPLGSSRTKCVNAYADNTVPTFTMTNSGGTVAPDGATSTATITINASDSGGIERISVVGASYSSTAYISDVQTSPSVTFPSSGTLADGSYNVNVYDLAGNAASQASFTIDTSPPSEPLVKNRANQTFADGLVSNNSCILFQSANSGAGVCRLWSDLTSSTATFSGGASTGVYVGSFCSTSSGTYTVCAEDCAGNRACRTVTVSTAAFQVTLSGIGPSWSESRSEPTGVDEISTHQALVKASPVGAGCSMFTLKAAGGVESCLGDDYQVTFGPSAPSFDWELKNVSQSTFSSQGITINGGFVSGGGTNITWNDEPGHPYSLYPGQSLTGTFTIPEVLGTTYTYTRHSSTLSVSSPFLGVDFSTQAALSSAQESARLLQVLRQSGSSLYDVRASSGMGVFASTITLSFQYSDAVADTTTLRIFRFEGFAWSSAVVTAQSASRSGNEVTVVGASTRTGVFGAFFGGSDSSAPATAFSIQGSSYVFTDTLFVSTYSYAVLTATDPAVNGYASQVSTTYYRLDASSTSTAFSIYSSSIPLPLGTHVLEYRSYDYAGNSETVETATFTVTAGTAFKNMNDHVVAGKILAGFLGSGARAEVESRAEDAYTLLASSPNKQALLAVSNIGNVGVGVDNPEGRLDLGVAPLALQLRSGNTVSTGTAVQVALGYDGDQSMRHAIRTHHGATAAENRMDFLIWSPSVGSTATIAQTAVMSLQAMSGASYGSMHVRPYGTPDVELEVSSGTATGGGTMQRGDVLITSSRRFKSDIKYLGSRDEDKAFEEVAGLRHVRFRYKTKGADGALRDDPAQPVHVGMIYEEMPEALQGEGKTILVNERMAEVELALKAAIRRMEELEARYKALKERRGKP